MKNCCLVVSRLVHYIGPSPASPLSSLDLMFRRPYTPRMNGFLIAALLFATPIASAGETPATPIQDLHRSDLNELFDQTIPATVLRGLLNQALTTLQDYVEVEATLPSDEPSRRQAGEFRLKLFPQGKSRSQEHLAAEGSFRLSPDADQQEFTLRFKSSKKPQRTVPPLNDEVI